MSITTKSHEDRCSRAYPDKKTHRAGRDRFIGRKIKIVHGKYKVIDYLAEHMPNLSLVPEAETNPVDTGILTHTDLVVDTRPIEAFLKHDARKGIAGTYSKAPSGEFDSVWIHQDECFWEPMFINFREN